MTYSMKPWLVGLTLSFGASVAIADKFPERPIRLVVGYSAGGPSDMAARTIAAHMSQALGQPVVVENRPGASGMIAATYVASQAKDGYTLLVATNQLTMAPWVYKKVSYKLEDFVSVGLMQTSSNGMAVSASLPVRNATEFVAYAKSHPGEINYAILGPGSSNFANAKMLERIAGIKMQEVSYQGAGPATQDLLAGLVQLSFSSLSAVLPHVESGKVKILGITGEKRLESLPTVPTLTEQGIPLVQTSWQGLMAPAGTPDDRVERLNKALNKGVAARDYIEAMKLSSTVPTSGTPDEMAKFVQKDSARWGEVFKPLNLQLN